MIFWDKVFTNSLYGDVWKEREDFFDFEETQVEVYRREGKVETDEVRKKFA